MKSIIVAHRNSKCFQVDGSDPSQACNKCYERLTINIVASVMKAGIPCEAGAICGPELQLFSLQQVTFL